MKIKWMLISGVLFTSNVLFALNVGTAQEGYDSLAQRCKNMDCINQRLQMIDRQIADLVNKRMAIVRAGALIKNADVLIPNTPTGGDQILKDALDRSKSSGADPAVNAGVFNELNKHSLEIENQVLKKPNSQ